MQPSSARQPGGVNPWWFASTFVLLYLYYWVFAFLFSQSDDQLPVTPGSPSHVIGARLTNLVLIGLLGLVLGLRKAVASLSTSTLTLPLSTSGGDMKVDLHRNATRPSPYPSPGVPGEGTRVAPVRLRRWALAIALAIFFSFHLSWWYWHQKQAWLFVHDLGTTTAAADRELLQGHNPYTSHIDVEAEKSFPAANVGGYKYLPVTLAAYMPLTILCKDRAWGILLSNLIISIGGFAALAACVRKWISLDAALLAGILFFMPTIITDQQLRHGCNDMLPMIFLMAALWQIERRGTCGLLVGLAISAKLLPGMLWLPICLTPKSRGRYFSGMAIGALTPVIPFLIWDAPAVVRNVILFQPMRGGDMSGLFYQLPQILPWMAAGLAGIVYLWMFRRAWTTDAPPIRRCWNATVLTMLFLLAATRDKPNYYIWWFVPFCVLVAAGLMNPRAYLWLEREKTA